MTELNLPIDTPVHIAGVNHYSYRIKPFNNDAHEIFLINTETHGHLKCGPQGNIKNSGGKGEWSRWLVSPQEDDGTLFSLQNVGHKGKGDNVFLGVSNGVLVPVQEPQPISFEAAVCEEEDAMKEAASPSFVLSDDAKRTFIETGILHLPGLIPDELVNNALASINEALGMAWEGDEATKNDPEQGYLATSRKSPAILDLMYKSPVFRVLKQLLGKPKRPEGAQIALRFPNNRNPPDTAWHIDGTDTTHMNPFQILVGIALSAQPTDDCGNLVVFPGHHRQLHYAVRRAREARQDAVDNSRDDANLGPSWMKCRPLLNGDDSTQIHLQPGDVVLAHQKIPHRVAHNTSPHIRYMVYFRISHRNHRPHGPLGDLWEHFEGLEDLLDDNDEMVCST